MKRRRPHPNDHEWREPSLVSERTVDVSPLVELSRILGESIDATSPLTPPSQDDMCIYSPAHENKILREPWNSRCAPSCRSRYASARVCILSCVRRASPITHLRR